MADPRSLGHAPTAAVGSAPNVGRDLLDRLAHYFRLFVEADCNRYTPLYARLALATADDPELLSLLAAGQRGQQRPVLFFAAVHDLVLASPGAELARYYPSVSGERVPPGDPFPLFRQFCLEHRDEMVDIIATRSTQTNETNRSVALRAALGAATADLPDQPIALLEVGASAGLNLKFDRYCLPDRFGPPDSPVRLATDLVGERTPPFDVPLPPIAWRAGLDRSPISVGDDREVRWLEACLWPEQVERVARFRAAVEVARSDPAHLVAGDMVDDLAEVASSAPPDAHLVIWHSWALTYLSRDRRPAFAQAIANLASDGRAVTWLSAEGPGVVPDLRAPTVADEETDEIRYATLLGMQRVRRGAAPPHELLARCHPHLRWLEWMAPAARPGS